MTLERWLEIATHDLTAAAARRVRREYMDAFEDAQAAGEANVLASWGDPHGVNRELRRVHLTEREARRLHPGYAATWAGLGQALREDAGFIVGIWLYALVNDGNTNAERWVGTGTLLALACLRWRVASWLTGRVWWRAVLHWLLQPITLAAAVVGWTLAHAFDSPNVWTLLTLGNERGAALLIALLAWSSFARHLLHVLTSLRAARKLEGGQA